MPNDGALYPFGSSIWAVGSPFTAAVSDGPTFQIQVPATTGADRERDWEMNWGCPVPGSEIAAVRFSALRTQAASSLEVRVAGRRRRHWAEPDSGDAGLPGRRAAYESSSPRGTATSISG